MRVRRASGESGPESREGQAEVLLRVELGSGHEAAGRPLIRLVDRLKEETDSRVGHSGGNGPFEAEDSGRARCRRKEQGRVAGGGALGDTDVPHAGDREKRLCKVGVEFRVAGIRRVTVITQLDPD
jgi:hypothetical protein